MGKPWICDESLSEDTYHIVNSNPHTKQGVISFPLSTFRRWNEMLLKLIHLIYD